MTEQALQSVQNVTSCFMHLELLCRLSWCASEFTLHVFLTRLSILSSTAVQSWRVEVLPLCRCDAATDNIAPVGNGTFSCVWLQHCSALCPLLLHIHSSANATVTPSIDWRALNVQFCSGGDLTSGKKKEGKSVTETKLHSYRVIDMHHDNRPQW